MRRHPGRFIVICVVPLAGVLACSPGSGPVTRVASVTATSAGPTHEVIEAGGLPLGSRDDFSVQFRVRTDAGVDERMVLLSNKRFGDNSLASQKAAGWVFYVSGGTWAWNIGSGTRRLTYERDNGQHMPVNDERWHQLTMTHDSARSEVRLYFDGVNRAVYHVADATGFDFTSTEPVVAGWDPSTAPPDADILPAIQAGAGTLQALVDEFSRLSPTPLAPDEFIDLIADPGSRLDEAGAPASVDLSRITALESELMQNPYTAHQVAEFIRIAPLGRTYSLVDGTVTIDEAAAASFAASERLDPPRFEMEDLAFWDRVLSPDEIARASDADMPAAAPLAPTTSRLTAAAWNIWHGGKHFTVADDGWDSRLRIAEMIREEGVDVVMMQETYSSGDMIAAELGYYFATTVDWDYLNQGANISVISRYPITDLYVQEDSPFMNIGVTLAVSETQQVHAMSNWYGMDQFEAVFEFHEGRFGQSDTIPTLFAGDFNAVPHTDGGDSPASRALLDAGFTDAYRETWPDPATHPGPTHRSGRRIDQLYYKGAGLTNASTRLISTWPTGFPSDHFMIVTTFDLAEATGARRHP